MPGKYHRILKTLGPGILFASTCIGVSHLVQSTRAGAVYGFSLLLVVVLANIFKYPFFEFASRYTNATGKSIIDGYFTKGRWILLLYFLITLPSMFVVTAAVTFVTSGLLANLIPIQASTDLWTAIILFVCIVVLALGRYRFLDQLLKVVGVVLLLSTLTAFFSVLLHGRAEPIQEFIPPRVLDPAGIIFLIALMGWMPTAVDISTWISLWAEAKIKESGFHPTLRESSIDFNFGYWASAFLAICFLTLGSYIIYGTGIELSNSSPKFAEQLINMFTTAIGKWSYYVIALAALCTMFSTSITVVDGYARAVTRTISLLFNFREQGNRLPFISITIVLGIGTYLVVSQYLNNLKQLVDLATIVSFVIAPLAGYLNYYVIFSQEIKPEYRPPLWLKNLALMGLVFLTIFTFIFVWVKIDPEGITSFIDSFM
ncbi:MAG: divalent metal cation transporter [Bacteroidetes bacterium]|nr:divalent metal cation transporter [Bacteroidota bacterium]